MKLSIIMNTTLINQRKEAIQFLRNLCFDLQFYIAKLDATGNIWFVLSVVDPIFKKYARSSIGIIKYTDLYTKCIHDNDVIKYTLFGKLHRVHDLPASEWPNGTKEW